MEEKRAKERRGVRKEEEKIIQIRIRIRRGMKID